ncbi:collagen alpha-3(V) chain-like isoform X2 [Branchiostoma floridae x Branchiostoma belcheri]
MAPWGRLLALTVYWAHRIFLAHACGESEPIQYSGKKYDLLERLRVPDLPHGIRQTCDDVDCLAYDIEPYAMLSAPTEEVFPEGFPTEFTISAKLQYYRKSFSNLFAILDPIGRLQLSIKLSPRDIELYTPSQGIYSVSVPDLDDGLWHSFAVSATYDMIVFYFDCEWMDTLHIVPSPHYIQMDGITLLGGQVDFSEVPFEGSIQQLMIFDDPLVGAVQCSVFLQNCKQDPVLGQLDSETTDNRISGSTTRRPRKKTKVKSDYNFISGASAAQRLPAANSKLSSLILKNITILRDPPGPGTVRARHHLQCSSTSRT